VLIEPDSIVAARDARAVRAAVDTRAILRDLWLDDERVFAAAVRVCAPVLERRAEPREESGGAPDGWSRFWARALGLPEFSGDGDAADFARGGERPASPAPTLGDRARVVAGFRDQYYGMVGLVREHAPDDSAATAAPLVTSGAIDWAGCTWGRRPIRFAKAAWRAPVLDLRRIGAAPPVVRRWVDRTRAPKVLVAMQTRVVEAAVDVEGTWVPSVPVVAVVPTDPDDLWRLAAALLAPASTAWLARRAAGTALDRGRLKVAGPDLAALPLPDDDEAWDAAAAALRGHVTGSAGAGHASEFDTYLDAYLEAIGRAYGTPDRVTGWWRGQAGTIVRPVAADG
jgi:hypothetical protein